MKKPGKYDHLRKPPGSVHNLYEDETKGDKIERIGGLVLFVLLGLGVVFWLISVGLQAKIVSTWGMVV